ncbi:MAG: GNAT family N-acetyltransferase [Lachnospiraceae bacterium]|nr:GNAT family N-acetyltransferase [Lachnospiraceae bacterium]
MVKNEIQIRVAKVEDAEELVEIYAPYVKETAITFEYEVPSVEEFADRIRKTLTQYPYLVAVIDSEIVGYAYAGAFKTRPAYDWAVELSVYVKKDKRHMGVGRQLYDALEELLKKQNILNLNACIAYPENEDEYLTKDSVAFHQSMGYRMVGQFHQCGYKFNRWYHMVWMEKLIGEHIANQPQVKKFSPLIRP